MSDHDNVEDWLLQAIHESPLCKHVCHATGYKDCPITYMALDHLLSTLFDKKLLSKTSRDRIDEVALRGFVNGAYIASYSSRMAFRLKRDNSSPLDLPWIWLISPEINYSDMSINDEVAKESYKAQIKIMDVK